MRPDSRYLLPARRAAVVAGAALALGGLAGAGAAAARPPAGGPAAASGAGWGRALEVPGSAALNTGGSAGIGPVSCASPGNCTAGGSYAAPGPLRLHALVVSQVRGRWQRAGKVPGMAVLNRGLSAGVSAVSCASPGNCTAGGSYADRLHHSQAFVVSEVRGRWDRARQVPGSAGLNAGGSARIGSVSCAAPGNCTAAGSYADPSHNGQAFVVSQVHGTWGRARRIPGLAALGGSRSTEVSSVSCGSPGNCSAGGDYQDAAGSYQAFAVSQVRGIWGRAVELAGPATFRTGGFAQVSSVSCASAGNCTGGGIYEDVAGDQYPFVVSEVHGTWSTARDVPGMAAVSRGGTGLISSVSCAAAGSCSAGGIAGDNNGYDVGGGGQPFVVTQARGSWGKALLVPGMTALNSGVDGDAESVSCATPGNCAATGYYGVGSPGNKVYNLEVFVASQVSGRWGRALEIPGTAALNKRHWAGAGAVSCPAPGRCAASGGYADGSGRGQAYVVSQP